MIYQVTVDSWYHTGRVKVPTKLVRRIFLIKANDCEEAMRIGLDWAGFETREGAKVKLPFEIKP